MMVCMRGPVSAAATALAALALAGCAMNSPSPSTTASAPPQLAPVQSSSVQSNTLPPLGGTAAEPMAGGTTPVAPGLSGTPVLGGAPTTAAPAADGSFASLDPATGAPAGGRDLSTGLSVEKLLGGWTVASGPTQCRLNLTYTAKAGTNRHRASAPACGIAGLAGVASWALVGNGVQLYDEAGTIVAAMQLSGNRFIGTVAGGAAISMAG